MAKKVAPNSAVSSAPSTTPAGTGTTTTPASTHPVATVTPTTTTKKVNAAPAKNFEIVRNLWAYYKKDTPQRTKLIDVFMVFLMAVGVLQFLYCILAGNYPFNAFLSGFGATVGQFVLTASLRIQTTEANKSDFPAVSPERAFADYVVGSLILHFFVINFIN